jgi:hypothetical protein
MVEIGHQEQRERAIYEAYSNLRLPPSDCYTDNVVMHTLSSITSLLSSKVYMIALWLQLSYLQTVLLGLSLACNLIRGEMV